jgi:hypothetical protein
MDQLAAILPTDIVHHIVGYTGKLKLRNGKYMGQISKSDPRYVQLNTIPKPLDSIYNSINKFVRTVVFKGNTYSIRVEYSSYPRWQFSETNGNCVKYSFKSVVQCSDVNEKYVYKRF